MNVTTTIVAHDAGNIVEKFGSFDGIDNDLVNERYGLPHRVIWGPPCPKKWTGPLTPLHQIIFLGLYLEYSLKDVLHSGPVHVPLNLNMVTGVDVYRFYSLLY